LEEERRLEREVEERLRKKREEEAATRLAELQAKEEAERRMRAEEEQRRLEEESRRRQELQESLIEEETKHRIEEELDKRVAEKLESEISRLVQEELNSDHWRTFHRVQLDEEQAKMRAALPKDIELERQRVLDAARLEEVSVTKCGRILNDPVFKPFKIFLGNATRIGARTPYLDTIQM